VKIFLEKMAIEVEIATSCSLETKPLCKRYDSYTRQYPYLPENGKTYEKVRKLR
jgi:hypothetical protein